MIFRSNISFMASSTGPRNEYGIRRAYCLTGELLPMSRWWQTRSVAPNSASVSANTSENSNTSRATASLLSRSTGSSQNRNASHSCALLARSASVIEASKLTCTPSHGGSLTSKSALFHVTHFCYQTPFNRLYMAYPCPSPQGHWAITLISHLNHYWFVLSHSH